ncbi:MAG: addiction module toxin, HicA family [Candidatus Aminicenantes bacterium]|nr:addiction module toxin, HicA family [Candidatus Aminicenantes bacterium]
MGILVNISARDALKAFEKIGYSIDHQTGSHMILFHPQRSTLSLPKHKELAPGLLRALIRNSGISVGEFLDLLRK